MSHPHSQSKLSALRDKDGKLPAYAWPGGYPIYYVMDDGDSLCPKCINEESDSVHEGGAADGWRFEGSDINWEDPQLYCSHCGNRIESAYAEDDAQ